MFECLCVCVCVIGMTPSGMLECPVTGEHPKHCLRGGGVCVKLILIYI